IYALGIRHVGETTAKDLARHFGGLDALVAAAAAGAEDGAALMEVEDVGPVVAESVARFFGEAHNREVMPRCRRRACTGRNMRRRRARRQARSRGRRWC